MPPPHAASSAATKVKRAKWLRRDDVASGIGMDRLWGRCAVRKKIILFQHPVNRAQEPEACGA